MKKSISILALSACLMWGVGIAAAQEPKHEEHHADGAAKPSTDHGAMGMGGQCAMMQKDMDKMDADMHQMHEKMQKVMGDMDAATGPGKMDKMAGAMREMMGQMETMHKMHSGMMHKMMMHMGEHMMEMPPSKAKEDMMMCPMMKGHGASGESHGKEKEGAPGAHDEHATPPAAKPDDHSAHHPPA